MDHFHGRGPKERSGHGTPVAWCTLAGKYPVHSIRKIPDNGIAPERATVGLSLAEDDSGAVTYYAKPRTSSRARWRSRSRSLSLPLFFVDLWLVHYFSGDSAFGHNLNDGVCNKLKGVVSDPGVRIFRPRDFGLGVGDKRLREPVV
ncbi:hypothetical protein B0H14DRAFT_2561723 [Mycena olivaceomarginata]|nr:hypothetical protein B0H14DRAFT_2561723 [Mycena olivaceomarginata]